MSNLPSISLLYPILFPDVSLCSTTLYVFSLPFPSVKLRFLKNFSPSLFLILDNTDFAELIPNKDYRKKFYIRDSMREKYFLKSNFINYVNLNYV